VFCWAVRARHVHVLGLSFPPRRSSDLTVCICHGVTAGRIAGAIAGGACSLAAVGEATQAGTGCGSCRPEINALLARIRVPEPA
jgi:NAD(P)H-nitrite reductase large subunit